MGKGRLYERTRPNERMAMLITELRAEGRGDKEIAEMAGTTKGYISKIVSGDRKGLGADIVLAVRDSDLKLDPDYFFDDDKPKSYKLYRLDERRQEKRTEALEREVAELRSQQERSARELAELRAMVSPSTAPAPTTSTKLKKIER